MKKLSLLIILFGGMTLQVRGQAANDSIPGIYKWMEKQGISLRKTFDGSSKDEGKPASFYWNRNFKADDSYATIDLGLKIKELEIGNRDERTVFLVFPKLEWHKEETADKEKEKNSLGGGLNAEFYPVAASDPNLPVPKGWEVAPWFLTSSDYKRDMVKETGSLIFKGFVSLYSTRDFFPGKIMRDGNDNFIFRYYVYSGVEHYRNLTIEDQEASFWGNRIFVELYPVPSFVREYVQLTLDYSYRYKIDDNYFSQENMHWFTTGLNIYPDGHGKIGFGVEYSEGNDPTNDFASTKKVNLGLKIKI